MSLATALVAIAPLACSPGADAASASLEAGRWTGEVEAPGALHPIGVEYEVARSGTTRESGAIAVRSLDFAGLPPAPGRHVSWDGRTLRFRWQPQRAERTCVLERQDGGALVGICGAEGVDDWRMRMLPPAREAEPTGLAIQAIARGEWQREASALAMVYAPRADTGRVDVRELARRVEQARAHDLALLEAENVARTLHVFVIPNREAMRELLGRPSGGYADPMSGTVVLTDHGRSTGVMRHEIMHVLSMHAWGPPAAPSEWLREGIATWAAGDCQRANFHAIAAHMLQRGRLLPLDELFGNWFAHPDLITYLQAASLVEWLQSTHPGALRAAWRDGLPALSTATGGTLPELERNWLEYVRDTPPIDDALWQQMDDEGCG